MTRRLYTIKEASLRTGLSTQLIRKWEERYGAVNPERLPNGYRGYSEADIETIRLLKLRVDEGVPIGMAVLELAPAAGRGSESPLAPGWDPAVSPPPRLTDAEWREQAELLLNRIERLDAGGSRELLERAIAAFPMEQVLLRLLEPVLVELGERWARGDISEYQEHFGSHFIRDRILSLRETVRTPAEKGPLLVTACGPGERHELGILFFGFFAMRAGCSVIYLGPSPCEKGLLDCVRELRPFGLALSFARTSLLEAAAPFLRRLDETIAEASAHTLVFVGGGAVSADGVLPGTSRILLTAGNAKVSAEKVGLRLRKQA